MLSSVLGWVGLSPGVSDDPLVPVQSPALWAVLSWVRRQGERSLAGDTPALGSTPTQNGLTIDDPVTADLTAAGDQGAQQAAAGTSMAALSAPVTIDAAAAAAVAPPALVQVSAAVPQTNQSSVPVTYTGAQVAGDTNILAIGWNNTTSTLTAVTDSAGNTYQLAVPTATGSGISQAIYYAPNIKAAAAGTNTVTATFDAPTPYVDLRAVEYSGLDPVNPFDVGASASGTGTSATSGAVSTTAANALIFGAGTTTGGFAAEGTNFTTRIITTPDADIAGDQFVTSTGTYSATAPLNGSAAWVMQVATFRAVANAAAVTPPALVQVSAAVPQTNQSSVPVTYTGAQVAGDTNILAIGWNNTTSTLTAVTDSAGNTYQLAVPTATGSGISQAIYYAPNIKAAAAGTNTVTATFDAPTPYVDLRAVEYSGLDPVNPFDVGASASGTGTSATSGAVSTTAANALIFGAGTTTGGFAAEGTNFTTRIITTPDADIAGDQFVTSTGTYSATAPLNGSAAWVMQVATFRAAVNVANTGSFENEVLATGLDLPTALKFLPDGRMLVAELPGTIKVLPPPYTQADPTPFLQLTNVGSAGDGTVAQQGIYDLALDPNFATNHFYYISYTAGTPNRDRLSRFTADATLTGTVPGSELIIYQDPQDASSEHHGGAINFGNDGKIYLTTGEHFQGTPAQDLTSPRGKVLRFNPDGTVPTDNPFYDGNGPNYDAVWALGLRNPYRAYYDAPTGRLLIGDVGFNTIEELDVGVRGANYGWPDVEGTSSDPAFTNPIYSYPHTDAMDPNGRDAAITGGFVYHGDQFPSAYQGSYFFADYAQNWIKRLTFDPNGNVNGVFDFEPADGAPDGPTGDVVYLTQGPEGALYYIDLGVSDTTGVVGVSKIHRISFVGSNQPPVAQASANPTSGPTPLVVNFSSAGSSDPEGQPLSYSWDFGDASTSPATNPTHTYTTPGPYQVRLTVSDGVNSTISDPLSISAGNRPTVTILSPTDGATFRAGDVITFSGSATDVEDGTLPASAYTWKIDFLHEGHVHPGTAITGVTSGTFTIPTTGHDFSGFTRYQVSLTVTDSSGLQSASSVTVFPQKINLNFATVPAGGTVFLDGIAHTAPFVYDTLIGFNHTISAPDQTIGANTYTFASWSDGGASTHTIVVPEQAQTYTANFN